MSNITETLKARLDELDLDRRLNEFVDQAQQSVESALAGVGGLVQERRDDIDRFLDTTSSSINERTEGKYADQVGKLREHLDAGLAKLAQQRRSGSWSEATDSPNPRD